MSGHVAPKSMYYAVFAALMVGTAVTVEGADRVTLEGRTFALPAGAGDAVWLTA